jgi:RNA polymerase sigma-70 factor (ECF subfamily)
VSEAELIAQARQGDATAWSTLIRTHQDGVFRLAYLLLGDAAEAEDVAQEVFLAAYQAFDRFDVARPLRPWLLQITRNRAHNRRRAGRRYLAALQRWWSAVPPDAAPVAASAASDDATALYTAIASLAPADQEVIYLRYFLELPVEETAQVLGTAPGTVKSRLARALGRLRPLLAEEMEPWQTKST